MSNAVEKKLAECQSTIEEIESLAISLGINPTHRWFRDETGLVPLDIRRAAGLPNVKAVDAYRDLAQMLEKLRRLKAELEAQVVETS